MLDVHRANETFLRVQLADDPNRNFVSDCQPGEALKLVLPPVPQPIAPNLPTDPAISLRPYLAELQAVGRAYTLRNVDPVAATFDLDFLLHGSGPAVSWAEAADPGWTVFATGKRFAYHLPAGAERLTLFGDATAIPAISEILGNVPDLPTRAVIALDEATGAPWLAAGATQAEVRWVGPDPIDPDPIDPDQSGASRTARGTARAGTGLVAALNSIDLGPGDAVWAACETSVLAALRTVLRRDRGLARDRVDLSGYWRLGVGQDVQQKELGIAAAQAAKTFDVGNQYSFESFDPEVDLPSRR